MVIKVTQREPLHFLSLRGENNHAMGWAVEDSGFDFHQKQEIFLF
jgi:hypothetical protein